MNKNRLFIMQMVFIATECLGGDFSIDGMVSGKFTETHDRIVIEGATFVSNGSDSPAIKVGNNLGKDVIIANSRFISNNQRIRDTSGLAGVVVINNIDSNSKITMRNLDISSRNANISSESSVNDVSAGVIVNYAGASDSSKSVLVTTNGQTNISASQVVRPDYRKIAK